MRHSSESLLTIINDILDFSKIEADELELECVPLDVRAPVWKRWTCWRRRRRRKGINLAYPIAPSTPDAISGRRDAHPPDSGQPAQQCGQVHPRRATWSCR
ncbi:MAG: hypothetical protein U0452_12285 [Anaerolineae bacterium]